MPGVYARQFTNIITFNHQYSYLDFTDVEIEERGLVNSSIVSKAREVEEFVQNHQARKRQSQDLDTDLCFTSESLLLLTTVVPSK
jgi:hypothetical protein